MFVNLATWFVSCVASILPPEVTSPVKVALPEVSKANSVSVPKSAELAILNLSENHTIRSTFTSAVRNPTLLNQYMYYNIGRAKLVGNIQGYEKEIDVFYATVLQNKLKCYCTFPHITKQSDGYSDIQQNLVSYELLQK